LFFSHNHINTMRLQFAPAAKFHLWLQLFRDMGRTCKCKLFLLLLIWQQLV
jgi:hypothetical protein